MRTEYARKNKGELTHMDLWGKYDVSSINGHQYYLLLVDDATRYVTVYFLKGKHEAAQHVKNYLTYLHVRGISTHAIRVDRGTETYSPSKNGVAERMNRTLVELARTMLTASKLSEYLWEPAGAMRLNRDHGNTKTKQNTYLYDFDYDAQRFTIVQKSCRKSKQHV